ncbi:dienelactone hydrolase family protein [Bdellovibrio sp. SKB1291214]|uniref:dienelactone hydrolase family protein n=1 Tax=Bdellovibrio sp. SKB1291214 TaxID=1732569 RepID=UPI000B519D14|nr:dienelactone hydrolase family protein [Bdellovibrio sp. SKB1291214]UYL08510.1 dienelactone hydrolase family protein [Bdellovibrio sp. SKB1291214]
MSYDKTRVQTHDGPMTVHIVTPDKETGKLPALIVLQEAFGVNHHILNVCKKLAEQGYVALAPELFHRAGEGVQIEYTNFAAARPIIAELTNARMVDDLAQTYKLAQTLPTVNSAAIGTIGFCMGGVAAVLAACHLDIQAAISYYGGGMTEERPGFGFKPFMNEFKSIKCPVLLGFGEADQSIPPQQIELIKAQLKAAGVTQEIIIYPEAGHGFLCDERSAFHPKMADKGWKDIFNWLKHCGTMNL